MSFMTVCENKLQENSANTSHAGIDFLFLTGRFAWSILPCFTFLMVIFLKRHKMVCSIEFDKLDVHIPVKPWTQLRKHKSDALESSLIPLGMPSHIFYSAPPCPQEKIDLQCITKMCYHLLEMYKMSAYSVASLSGFFHQM